MKTGPVNEEWDRQFLKLITEKDYETLRSWSTDLIEEHFGNGGQEIHNWLVLMGALRHFENSVAFYEPIPEWVTGMAIVQFSNVIELRQSSIEETMSV